MKYCIIKLWYDKKYSEPNTESRGSPYKNIWLRGEDSNLRPLGYEPNELPTAPPRDVLTK